MAMTSYAMPEDFENAEKTWGSCNITKPGTIKKWNTIFGFFK